jgi:hypothetical protein
MPEPERQHWEELYRAALVELDGQKLHSRILLAEEAMQQRLRSLRNNSNHHEERHAIDDALQNLRVLRHAELPGQER